MEEALDRFARGVPPKRGDPSLADLITLSSRSRPVKMTDAEIQVAMRRRGVRPPTDLDRISLAGGIAKPDRTQLAPGCFLMEGRRYPACSSKSQMSCEGLLRAYERGLMNSANPRMSEEAQRDGRIAMTTARQVGKVMGCEWAQTRPRNAREMSAQSHRRALGAGGEAGDEVVDGISSDPLRTNFTMDGFAASGVHATTGDRYVLAKLQLLPLQGTFIAKAAPAEETQIVEQLQREAEMYARHPELWDVVIVAPYSTKLLEASYQMHPYYALVLQRHHTSHPMKAAAAPLSEETARDWVQRTIRMVCLLHRHNLVHGLITPSHIVVTEDGQPLLIDLAYMVPQGQTRDHLPRPSERYAHYLNEGVQAGRNASFDDDWQSMELVWANAAQGTYREWAVPMVREAAEGERREQEQNEAERRRKATREPWGERAGSMS